MKDATAEWVLKAEDDFEVAQRALGSRDAEPPITDAVCFHCQQCAEKYLKAFLRENDTQFRPAHPLIPLLEICLTIDDEFEPLRDDLQDLEGFAVAVRYPGIAPTVEIAERAIVAARRVRTFARAKLMLEHPGAQEGNRE
jgi:HEPN domain-containing protein